MVIENYDSFIDPINWTDDEERNRLSHIFGWDGDPITGDDAARATRLLRRS